MSAIAACRPGRPNCALTVRNPTLFVATPAAAETNILFIDSILLVILMITGRAAWRHLPLHSALIWRQGDDVAHRAGDFGEVCEGERSGRGRRTDSNGLRAHAVHSVEE